MRKESDFFMMNQHGKDEGGEYDRAIEVFLTRIKWYVNRAIILASSTAFCDVPNPALVLQMYRRGSLLITLRSQRVPTVIL